jgi:hypothetical protein
MSKFNIQSIIPPRPPLAKGGWGGFDIVLFYWVWAQLPQLLSFSTKSFCQFYTAVCGEMADFQPFLFQTDLF